MKKNLLIVLCLFVSLAGKTMAATVQTQQETPEIKQKSCQNVFSFINIDLSVMSPRAAASDVSVVAPATAPEAKKGTTVAVSYQKGQKPEVKQSELKQTVPETKGKTSLFRIDLLHIFRFQVL